MAPGLRVKFMHDRCAACRQRWPQTLVNVRHFAGDQSRDEDVFFDVLEAAEHLIAVWMTPPRLGHRLARDDRCDARQPLVQQKQQAVAFELTAYLCATHALHIGWSAALLVFMTWGQLPVSSSGRPLVTISIRTSAMLLTIQSKF